MEIKEAQCFASCYESYVEYGPKYMYTVNARAGLGHNKRVAPQSYKHFLKCPVSGHGLLICPLCPPDVLG